MAKIEDATVDSHLTHFLTHSFNSNEIDPVLPLTCVGIGVRKVCVAGYAVMLIVLMMMKNCLCLSKCKKIKEESPPFIPPVHQSVRIG